jgi:hypothetical protein
VSVHGSVARFALTHTGALQNIQHVLALREKQVVPLVPNTDTQKMVKGAHVGHRELTTQCSNNPVKETRRGGSQHNIINIEKKKSHVSTSAVDEQRRVGLRLNKAK